MCQMVRKNLILLEPYKSMSGVDPTLLDYFSRGCSRNLYVSNLDDYSAARDIQHDAAAPPI